MNKILICGKGYSFKFFENFKNEYNLIFSYNHLEKLDLFDYNFLSLNKEALIPSDNIKILKESELNSLIKNTSIKIGSTTLGLFTLLKFISIKYPNSKVHLVGFDSRYIYEEKAETFKDISIQNYINVESQKAILNKLEYFFDNLEIKFVGFDIFSEIDAKTSENFELKNNSRIEIVAEITTNHFGDDNRIKELMTAAKKGGADSVKFQMRDVANFYSKERLEQSYSSPFGKTFREYREALELNERQLELIEKYSKSLDLNYFFSALDTKSYNILKEKGFKRVKIPSTISKNKEFISYVLEDFQGQLIISTGMTDEKYFDFIINSNSKYSMLYLLHCISSYPVNIFNLNLEIIKRYSRLSKKIIPGYSSHDIGYDGSMFAVFAGARMIEKHIKLGNTNFAHFDETALDVNLEFGQFVKMIRKAELISGSSQKKILKSEHHKY
jgi:N-acetylneuraminate synthase